MGIPLVPDRSAASRSAIASVVRAVVGKVRATFTMDRDAAPTASDPPGLLAGITPIGAAQTAATAPNGQGKGPSVFFNSEDQ